MLMLRTVLEVMFMCLSSQIMAAEAENTVSVTVMRISVTRIDLFIQNLLKSTTFRVIQ